MARTEPETTDLKNGDTCEVIKGTHAGKSGVVQHINTSAGGNVTITVVQSGGQRFKTLASNVRRSEGA